MRKARRRLFPGLLGLILIISCSTIPGSPPGGNIQPQPQIQPQQTKGEASMRVLWTVADYFLGPNAGWGNKEARELLFKPLDIDANTITFDGKQCRNCIFKKETVQTKEYLDKFFHVTPQMLNIEDEQLDVIKTDCNLPGFAEYWPLKDRRVVIQINGVFFFLEPAVNP